MEMSANEGEEAVIVPVLLCCAHPRQAGRCWRLAQWPFDHAQSSCSRFPKMRSVIGNFMQ